MDKFDDIEWEDLNWYGQWLVNLHHIYFPNQGYTGWEKLAIINFGLKSKWLDN